jgi:hypothetical protein
MDSHGLRQETQAHALTFDEVVFVGIRRHLFFRAPIDHRDFAGAQALGDGGAINRRVASADHHDIAADNEVECIQFALLDVLQSIDDVVFAGNAQGRRGPRPRPERRAKIRCRSAKLDPAQFCLIRLHAQFSIMATSAPPLRQVQSIIP